MFAHGLTVSLSVKVGAPQIASGVSRRIYTTKEKSRYNVECSTRNVEVYSNVQGVLRSVGCTRDKRL